MKISVLGVGTELTTGQILNKNASWISKQVKGFGVLTSAHLTVPDDRPLILESLKICALLSDIIFVTGGLGPTTDDFTREVIAEWSGKKLSWHEPSWRQIQDRLGARGFEIREMQKQQCYYPEGAEVLENTEGTANGFSLEAFGKKIFVLPGPPREIEAIWNLKIKPWMTSQTASVDAIITKSWDTMGFGESDIAKLTEEALASASLEIGYRVHIPYVEVKVTYPASKEKTFAQALEKLEKNIGPMTYLRDGCDVAEEFAKTLSRFSDLEIHDNVATSYLIQRVESHIRKLWPTRRIVIQNVVPKEFSANPETLVLFHRRVEENSVEVGFRFRRQTRSTMLFSPIKSVLMGERRQQYFSERALMFWWQNLQDL